MKNAEPLKQFNVALILNGDDAPDALSGRESSLLSLANVYMEKVTKESGPCEILEKALDWNGKPLDLVVVKGHGSEYGITLGKDVMLDTVNVRDVGHCFKKALAPGAPIALASCSKGKERPYFLNFAERLAGETGHPVDAATQASRGIECVYESKDERLAFRCEKIQAFDNDNGSEKMGVYTKRFIRYLDERDAETIEVDEGS